MTFQQVQMKVPGAKKREWHQHENGGGWVKNTAVIHHLNIYIGKNVIIRGGDFHGGDFDDGVFRGGDFHGGDFHGGDFDGGVFYGGDFHGGDFRGGVFRGGDFHGGVFRGGVFHGGYFHGGVFRGGVWKSAPLQIQGTRHFFNVCSDTEIQIGCEWRTVEDWKDNIIKIALSHEYTQAEAEEYKKYVELGAWFLERKATATGGGA